MANENMVAALQRLSGREILINTDTADEYVANLTRFAMTDRVEAVQHEATSREALLMAYGMEDRPEGEGRKPFVYQDGVGVIPVHGSLINRFGGSWGFVTGYNFIRRQMNLMLDDDDVEQIVFDVNSPGGEAAGCFELAREIMASRRVKDSLGIVDALAASGGMAILAGPTRAYAIPSARIGSIGVYRQHISVEGALKDAGVKITFAQAGEHKTDGQPYKDLPEAVLKEWTADVEKTWDDFIDLVAEGRGMSAEDVRATQARVYRADEALAKGLINAVKTTTDAVPAFVAEMAGDSHDDEEDSDMTTKPEATSVDYEKIGSMISAGVATAMSGVLAAQNRQNAIREHGKNKGQVALASKLAANDAITEADAIDLIDAAAGKDAPAPKAKAKAPKRGNRVEDGGDEGDDDGDGDEDGDGDLDGDEGDEGDEDEAEQARSNRRGNRVQRRGQNDNVNHLDGAMGRARRDKVGSGNGSGDASGQTGTAGEVNTLLADYGTHTGVALGKKA